VDRGPPRPFSRLEIIWILYGSYDGTWVRSARGSFLARNSSWLWAWVGSQCLVVHFYTRLCFEYENRLTIIMTARKFDRSTT
jgi:hypothetical protein